jgi:hypothetical protein
MPSQAAKETVEAAQQAGLAADELSTIRVFQANTPSVVNVTNIRAMQSYYSMDMERIPAGTGSGFVWDKQGEALCWNAFEPGQGLHLAGYCVVIGGRDRQRLPLG